MSPNTNKYVLIVGAGPVGLSLAVMLKQMNVPFRIIEKRTKITSYSRAFAIHSRTLEIFKQLNILEAIKSNERVNTIGVDVYQSGNLSFKVKLPPSESSESYTVGLIQSKTEEILEDRLKELGATIEHGVKLKGLDLKGNVVECVEIERLAGEVEKIYPSVIVGCDGGHSLVRKLSGILFTGESIAFHITCIDAVVETKSSRDNFGRR